MAQVIIVGGGVDREIASAAGLNDPPAIGNINGNNAHRYLMKFADADLAQIPADATITGVSLTVKDYDIFSNNGVTQWLIEIRRLLVDWSYDPSSGATWTKRNNADQSSNWTAPGANADGADRSATISASFLQHSTDTPAVRTYSGAGMVADVQYWIADLAGRNFGWLREAPQAEFAGSGYSYTEFYGMTASTPAFRPTLTVDYTPAANPPSVDSVDPDEGSTAGGTPVTISGSDFQDGATVTIGGSDATDVAFVNDGELTAVTPSGVAGAADVVVTNPDDQTGTLTDGFTYVTPSFSPGVIITTLFR
jgi:hypothetical protein